jgi:chloramphenicol-sensitive protein RarD
MSDSSPHRTGVWLAIAAFTQWGLLPIYWKWLSPVSPLQILCHRIVWSLLLLWIVLTVKRHWRRLLHKLRDVKTILLFTVSGLLLGLNWFTYIWSVNAGLMIEASLGYFMNPLVNVALGVFFFRERLRAVQWAAFALALCGVLYLTFVYGQLPWIGLLLAVTFGAYGLLRKIGSLESMEGLTFETLLLAPAALFFLIWAEVHGAGSFSHVVWWKNLLLAGAGIVTTLPLLCFAAAARKIDLSLMGILQYISPTLQFLIGALIYHEAFSTTRFTGFLFIWLALVIFSVESLWRRWQRRTVR